MRKSFYFLLFPLWVSPASVSLAQDTALIQAAKKEGKVVWYTSLAIPSSTARAAPESPLGRSHGWRSNECTGGRESLCAAV